MAKAGNVFVLDVQKVSVNQDTREISYDSVTNAITEAKAKGRKYFIVVANMMTTMYGSVDSVEHYTTALTDNKCIFKLHVDGAYGGFYFPFTEEDDSLSFKNQYITSFTLDAHKMAQAPYGTGIFLIRKNFISFTNTKEASYVEGYSTPQKLDSSDD